MLLKFLWGMNPQFLTEEGWQMKLSLRETLLWKRVSSKSFLRQRNWCQNDVCVAFKYLSFGFFSIFYWFSSLCFSLFPFLLCFIVHVFLSFSVLVTPSFILAVTFSCVFFFTSCFCPFPFVIPNFSTLLRLYWCRLFTFLLFFSPWCSVTFNLFFGFFCGDFEFWLLKNKSLFVCLFVF